MDLLHKLDQLVAMYRVRDWGGVYARLAQFPPTEESAIEFRERIDGAYPRNQGKNLVAFEPDGVVKQPANQWAIWGCATLEGKHPKPLRERWVVNASWERGEWFFTELLPVARLDQKQPVSCDQRNSEHQGFRDHPPNK